MSAHFTRAFWEGEITFALECVELSCYHSRATLATFNDSEAVPLDPHADTGIALVQHLPVEGHDNVREKRPDYRIRHSRLFTPDCGSCRVKLDHDA